MFQVTLNNPNADCAYKGKPCRTMPQAFRSARNAASLEFMTHGGIHAGEFFILFETASNAISRKPHISRVNRAKHMGGVSVTIERKERESE